MKVNNDLHYLNSNSSVNQKKKIELFNIENFQLDQDVTVSSKEMEILPSCYKNDLRKIFLSVINKIEVQKEIKQKNSTSISLKVIDGNLVYRLGGARVFQTLQDQQIQNAFKKIAKNIRKYLCNIGSIKEKQINVLPKDTGILKTGSSEIEKVSKEILKKMRKSDTEWSLWAVCASDIKSAIQKACTFLGIKFDWQKIPSGSEDVMGYLFGCLGILNGTDIILDSKMVGDAEGQREGKHKIMRNSLAITGSILEGFSKTITDVTTGIAKFVLGFVASFIFIFVTIYAFFRYAHLAIKANVFKHKFEIYTENEKLSEQRKMIAALKFLKNKISVTPEETCNIINKIRKQNPTLSDDKVKTFANKEIAKKLLTKIRRLERRIGADIVPDIQKELDNILKDPLNAENIKKAKQLLNKVKYENDLIIHENKWYAISTLLQTVEIVLVIILGYTALGALAGSISSVITVVLTGSYFYRKYIGKEKGIDKDDSFDKNLINSYLSKNYLKRAKILDASDKDKKLLDNQKI